MRSIAYILCTILVALPTLRWFVSSLLSLVKIQIPYDTFLVLFASFGSLIPSMFLGLVPRPLLMILGYGMIFLVLRRIWLFAVKKERTPVSFVGFQKVLGYVGFWSFSLSVLVMILSIVLKAGSGVPAGMLMIPAMFCVPWAFFITEVLSFKRKLPAEVVG